MKYQKIRIQIIGHGLSGFSEYLKQYEIYSESIIPSCSPLAMAGKSDEAFLAYADDPKTSMPTVINIRKNLSQILSHDPEKFRDNYNTLPYGAEVRDRNTSEYLIVMNSAAAFPLYEKNGVVFSHAWTGEKFIDKLKSDKTFTVRRFPFSGDFNWKHYYDPFIDAVTKEYDKDHIILIRLNSARWFMEGEEIHSFDNTSRRYRNAIEEIDDYFTKRTSCIVVNEHYSHIPNADVKNAFPYIMFSKKTSEHLAAEVACIIRNGSPSNIYSIPTQMETYNRLAAMLLKMLTSNTLNDNEKNVRFIIENNLSFGEIERDNFLEQENFFHNIVKLKYFLDYSDFRTLSDYSVELLADKEHITEKTDVEILELYTKYFKLDINDIIAFYMIYRSFSRKELLKSALENIVGNSECLPVAYMKRLCMENIAFLKTYPYLNEELKGKDESERIYVPIENNCYFILDFTADDYIKKITLSDNTEFNYASIIDNGYRCPITLADFLTYSYEYYSEKARKGDGAKPSYLKFANAEEFFDSLKYIDYKQLLKNDNFVFAIDGIKPQADGYAPLIDFTELVDPNTSLINVRNGLGDQICHYIMGEQISKNTNRNVIYFDLPCLKFMGQFNGSDFKMITKHPVKAFSNMISPRLKQAYNPNNDSALSLLGRINDYNLIVNSGYYNHPVIQNELKSTSLKGAFICDDIVRFVNTALPYSYYFNLIRIEQMKSLFNYRLNDYIEFPPFEEALDIELSEIMTSCDAIVVHVRRGDRAALGWNEDISFYPEAIEKIMETPQYSNKKFFVFSDDIKWCKIHRPQIGLDRVGECEVYFIEGHKGEECFRDVQLMTLGKMIVCGNSGFSRIAAMYSEKWEMLFCAEKKTDDFIHKYVRKNKYETKPFLKEDYSHINTANTYPLPSKCKSIIIKNREKIEWLNFWFDNGNEQRNDRVLLIGDSISREYRTPLAQLTKKPIDFFAVSTSISDEKFFEALEFFFSFKEYRQKKAHIQIGVHGINGFGNAVQNNSITEYEKGFEKLVNTVIKYIPDLTIALTTSVTQSGNLSVIDDTINDEIIKRNTVAKEIAEKHKLPVNDLYTLMLNEPHRDIVHFSKEGSDKIARRTAEAMKLI